VDGTRARETAIGSALAFAEAAIQRHSLPRGHRTPHDVIMGWLRPSLDDPDLKQEVTRRLRKPT